MTVLTNADLYLRGAETLLASFGGVCPRGDRCCGAALPRCCHCRLPERVRARRLQQRAPRARDLAAAERADALDAMEAAYAAAGVTRFAAWVHESDEAMRGDLKRRGYTSRSRRAR
jgi:hypothetical protein